MTQHTCSYCGDIHGEDDIIMFRSEIIEDVYICANCIDKCYECLEEIEQDKVFKDENGDINYNIKPSEMKKHFDDYIINQTHTKKVLAVAIYNHFKRAQFNDKNKSDMKLKKSNVMMVGPSGCGKTLFVETIAKKLNIPYAIQDATSLTQSGLIA